MCREHPTRAPLERHCVSDHHPAQGPAPPGPLVAHGPAAPSGVLQLISCPRVVHKVSHSGTPLLHCPTAASLLSCGPICPPICPSQVPFPWRCCKAEPTRQRVLNSLGAGFLLTLGWGCQGLGWVLDYLIGAMRVTLEGSPTTQQPLTEPRRQSAGPDCPIRAACQVLGWLSLPGA